MAQPQRRFRQYAKPYIAGVPVRRVVTKSGKRVTGYVKSVLNDGMVPYESENEKFKIYLLETAADVKSYQAQPEQKEYELFRKKRTYFPDFRVEYRNGETHIIEVKSHSDAMLPENQEVFEALRETYAADGITFRVVTSTDIREQPRLDNATEMILCRDFRPGPRLIGAVREIFALKRPSTLGELEQHLGFDATQRHRLFGMALYRHIGIEIAEMPLGRESPVFVLPPPVGD